MRASSHSEAVSVTRARVLPQALMQPEHLHDNRVIGQLPLMGPALRSSDDSRAQPLHGAAALRTASLALLGSHGTASYKQLPGSYGYVACSPRWLRCLAPHSRAQLLEGGRMEPWSLPRSSVAIHAPSHCSLRMLLLQHAQW